ncbi:PREDICTED: reverse mRNAase [Prunus dulcis]|uniref:PREDICTED: reverse mRNAase n=1 Tax=Prunus dulcis TaxID=3755 RepID=A0A5E4FLN0_PRUDU|nr:PREDICTED: reverse mRNAase [Prunus dulcis]
MVLETSAAASLVFLNPVIWSLILASLPSEVDALADVRDRINQKIAGWKLNLLSQVGREVLIKSVATAVPAYPVSCFLRPTTLCNTINSNLGRFWWGHDGDHGKIHWHSWKKLCTPKAVGGMGFRDLHAFNRSLLAKQCWRILRNLEALWARIFRCVEGSLVNWLRLWKDLPIPTNRCFTPLLVSYIIEVDNGTWNISHIEPFIPSCDAAKIRATPIGIPSTCDRLVWLEVKLDDYSIKIGYYHIIKSSPPIFRDRASAE